MESQNNQLTKYVIIAIISAAVLIVIFYSPLEQIGKTVYYRIMGGDIHFDRNRINILALGIRGIDDENGGLLTDTIVLTSLHKPTGKIVMFSIPRDLYLEMPDGDKKEKINFAYALGYEKEKNGLKYATETVMAATGVPINYAVAIDFEGFIKLIDALGGIDIYLDKPFIEDKQWHDDPEFASSSGTFILPTGNNHLNSKAALYYVRSRYSSSDFDRAERQQKVLMAIKDKVLKLNILTDYSKIKEIFSTLENNIETDMGLNDVLDLLKLSYKVDKENIQTKVFNTLPGGFLYESRLQNGTYIILPIDDNFDAIREYVQSIFKIN